MDDSVYESCSYCGKTIMPGVVQCPYCRNYTDDKGPLGMDAPRATPRWFLIAGTLALIAMLLFVGFPLIVAVVSWLMSLMS